MGPGHYETYYLPMSEQVLQKKTPIKVGFTRMDRGLHHMPPSEIPGPGAYGGHQVEPI